MFGIIFCCNQKMKTSDTQNDDYSDIEIDKDIIYDRYALEEKGCGEYENKRNETLRLCIEDLREAEKEANRIVIRAKKNRAEFLNTADDAAKEIVKPYYNMAHDELKEMEISLNKELHIKTLEALLSNDELKDEESEISEKVNEVVSTVLKNVCEVKLGLQNPEYISRQLNKHRIKSKTRSSSYNIKEKLKLLSEKMSNIKKEEKGTHKNKVGKKTKFKNKDDKQTSISTIELDEDYSKIDNMYGGSKIVNSFNTIHIN
ncbi:hypothetical protein FG379_001687 [Cryptosporidium bovis]|uniref:uncharacterized protein n=1 Tax=Cryptosporidium bovis TaxID=310047 RepID=UPI00351A8D32|nr:hypothetical protein FG379_001687 [Cryptosporidium bovis]